jgi:hypothetical protein
LAHTFASSCLGHEPKARVATIKVLKVTKLVEDDHGWFEKNNSLCGED